MSRQRSSRSGGQTGSPVSLFPFLAVLICTMGTLILLLVVINRSARTQAAGHAGIKTNEIIAELDIEAQTLAIFANDLQKSKELTIADIDNERARLAALESEIGKLEREIQQAEATLEGIRNNRSTNHSETGKLAEALAAKREALQRAEIGLQELQERVTNQKSTYAIVAYYGSGGTDRRPMYIECRSDCVVIQPEGIVLREDDFLTASHPDNPLDAILRAASLYYTENELVPQGTKPYPLIIVRPSGVDAYYAVRESIQSWGEQFGYELVEEDWTLEFPAANEALKQRLETQLAASRERMLPYRMMLMQQYAAANRLNGDMMSRPQSSSGGGMPGGNDYGPGNMGHGDGQGSGFENISWQDVMASAGGSSPPGYSAGRSSGQLPGPTRKQNVEYRAGPNGNMVRYVDGVPSEARVSLGSSRRDAGNRNLAGSHTDSDHPANSTGLGERPGTYPASVAPQYSENAASELTVMEPGQLYSETLHPERMLNGGEPEAGDLTGVATSGIRHLTANTQQSNTQQGDAQQNTLAAMLAQRREEATPQTTGTTSSDKTDTSRARVVGTMQGFGMIPTRPENENELAEHPDPMLLGSQNAGFGQVPTVTSMPVNVRPPAANWAMPDDKQSAMEVTRPIAVECRPQKILLRRSSGAGIDREIEIPPGADVYHVTSTLVSHVLDYIDAWGMAARGTYWQPEMIVAVQPGAEARFEELKSVMQNSGVKIRRK